MTDLTRGGTALIETARGAPRAVYIWPSGWWILPSALMGLAMWAGAVALVL